MNKGPMDGAVKGAIEQEIKIILKHHERKKCSTISMFEIM